METIDKDFSSSDLVITTQSKNFLLYAAKWASFLSIVGFVTLGLMVLGGLVILVIGSSFAQFGAGAQIGVLAFVYIGMAALYFFPVYYLFLFGQKIKRAVNSTSQDDLEIGFENLKSCFKFMGIFTIVIISLYLLIFLVAIVAGTAMR